jgi:integrase
LPVTKNIAKRERVLTEDEIGEVWRAAGDAGSPYGAIIRLLILTGQRRGEVAGMTWAELSDDLTSWTLPGERTKNGVAHVVPLSAPASNLLRGLLPNDANEAKQAIAWTSRPTSARWAWRASRSAASTCTARNVSVPRSR